MVFKTDVSVTRAQIRGALFKSCEHTKENDFSRKHLLHMIKNVLLTSGQAFTFVSTKLHLFMWPLFPVCPP